MIHDLDKTLEELLKRELPPELVSQVTISFATPDGPAHLGHASGH